jgi:hypothetical protein
VLKTPFTPEGCSSTLHSSDEALRVLRGFPNASHAVGASLCEYPQHRTWRMGSSHQGNDAGMAAATYPYLLRLRTA